MRTIKLTFLLLFLLSTSLFAAWEAITGGRGNFTTDPDFHLLYGGSGTSVFGDFDATGNSILISSNPTNANLINDTTTYKTVDPAFNTNTYSLSDNEKMNSSSAQIDLPSYVNGSDIIWAGLFWQGHVYRNTGTFTDATVDADAADWNKVTIKDSNGVMHPIEAPIGNDDLTHKAFHHTISSGTGYRHHYGAYHEVTNILKNSYSSVNNTFTVGNIKTTAGQDSGGFVSITQAPAFSGNFRFGLYGGWSLIVVYSVNGDIALANSVPLKNVSIYDGFDLFLTWGSGTVPFETTIDISGFYTPKSGPINSKLLFFGGAGDRGIQDDTLQIQNQNNVGTFADLSNTPNSSGEQFNHTYTRLGTHMTPLDTNKQGMDLDIFDVSSQMTNSQSETQIKFGVVKNGAGLGGNCDQVFPQVLAFSTQLYEPKLCYDYSYSQFDRYLTEESNGTGIPRIDPKNNQLITLNEPMNLKLFIRNEEASDVIASDVNLSILNINELNSASQIQAEYISNTTYESVANSSVLTGPKVDEPNTNSTQVLNIYNSTLDSLEYFYSSIDINPLVNDINLTLDARLHYKIQIYDANGTGILDEPIEYQYTLGKNMDLCADSGSEYNAKIDEFNIVHDQYYTTFAEGTIGGKYNLPTQVVNRNGNFKIIATDANISVANNSNMDLLKKVTTFVGVEIIDTGGWQDVETSCAENSNRRSSIIWTAFTDDDTSLPFDSSVLNGTDLDHYLYTEHTDSSNVNNIPLYSAALESAAFRITSFTPIDGVNPDFRRGSVEGWYLDNYVAYAGTECFSDPDPTNPPTATETVSQHCGDNSGHGIADFDMCVKCLMGDNIKRSCSRDNFSIRPEAFLLSIHDNNRSNGSTSINVLDSNMTGVPTSVLAPSNTTTHLAAGYNYELNATAVDHDGNTPAFRYTASFSETPANTGNFVYTWIPTINDTLCWDTDNSDIELGFTGTTGKGSTDYNLNEVGTYSLSMYDDIWTKVDQNPTHHTALKNFNTGINYDCIQNNTQVSAQISNAISGCDIDSTHTTSSGLGYQNPIVEFHPYQFGITNNKITLGLTSRDINNTDDFSNFVYMSNINVANDINMSVQINSTIAAQSFLGTNLTNFVTGCYAKPIDINISKTAPLNTGLTTSYSFRDLNSSAEVNGTIAANISQDANMTTNTLFFIKDLNGSMSSTMYINFDRNQNNVANPEDINYSRLTVLDPTHINANLRADYNASGTINMDQNVTHYFGRTAAQRTRIICNPANPTCSSGLLGEAEVLIYYEAYCFGNTNGNICELNLIPTAGGILVQKVDTRWYANLNHREIHDGNLTATVHMPGLVTVPTISIKNDFTKDSQHNYLINNGLPYEAIMTSTVPSWLIYEEGNPIATTNPHSVLFQAATTWTGRHDTDSNITTKTAPVRRVNRRTMW